MGSFTTIRKTTPVELEDDDNYSSIRSVQVMLEDPRGLSGQNLTLVVGLRRGRVALLTIACIAFIVASTYVFGRGVELMKLDASSMTQAERIKLLDQYNSRSGNIASVFGKPVELFVSLSAQIIVLPIAATSLLQPEPSWKAGMATLGVSATTGYLINNGFNSLNVQFRDDKVDAIVSAEDLSSASTINAATASRVTTLNHTVSEMTPGNPVENTVLRNLFLPRVSKPGKGYCDYEQTQLEVPIYLPDDTVEYAITQRDWQKRLLPVALESDSVRVVINPSNKTQKQVVVVDEFPMNASLAANLFMNGLFLATHFVPWGYNPSWCDPVAAEKRFPSKKGPTDRLASAAQVAGVLPVQDMTELQQREWFLRESPAIVNRYFNSSFNTSRSDIAMEFSHVSISPTIAFDSVTFEAQVNTSKIDDFAIGKGDTIQNGRMYSSQAIYDCAPWPGLCMYPKPDYLPTTTQYNGMSYDTPVQVNAFSVCVDASSGVPKEDLQVYLNYSADFYRVPCSTTSNSSMLIVSVAKRLVADASLQDTDSSSGKTENTANFVAVRNLKKIYSVTVGRLSWEAQDLSSVFSANCSVNPSSGSCSGIHIPLAAQESNTTEESATQQYVVVGSDALPFTSLSLPSYMSIAESRRRLRPVSLVKVHEAPRQQYGGIIDPFYEPAAGDLLLPHNVQDLRWNMDKIYLSGTNCSSHIEERTHQVVSNHLYMESGLQASYTAAMLYLFQDAVVHDVIQLSDGATTLNFKQNLQQVVVFVSIPRVNVWLTLAGCALLALGLILTGVWSACKSERTDPLRRITEPHTIAQVMMNERMFPPLLLHRHVIDPDTAADPHVDVTKFNFDKVTLKRVGEVNEWPTKHRDGLATAA